MASLVTTQERAALKMLGAVVGRYDRAVQQARGMTTFAQQLPNAQRSLFADEVLAAQRAEAAAVMALRDVAAVCANLVSAIAPPSPDGD